MWLELTSFLGATKHECSFADDILRCLLPVTESISGYFPDIEQHDINEWICSGRKSNERQGYKVKIRILWSAGR
jgi:hypothetical protein